MKIKYVIGYRFRSINSPEKCGDWIFRCYLGGTGTSIPREYSEREFKPISDYINYDTTKVSHPLHLELKK